MPIYSLHLITLLVLLFAVAHIVFIYCTMWWTLLRDIHRLCLLYWQLGGCVCKGVSIDHHKRDPSTHKKISTAPRRIDIHWIHWTKTNTHTKKRKKALAKQWSKFTKNTIHNELLVTFIVLFVVFV